MTKLKNRLGNILIRGTALTSSFSIETFSSLLSKAQYARIRAGALFIQQNSHYYFFFLFSRKGNQSKRHTE